MDENAEYCAIVAFTKDNDPTCEKNKQQFYALWTAYCIHHDFLTQRNRHRTNKFFVLIPPCEELFDVRCRDNDSVHHRASLPTKIPA